MNIFKQFRKKYKLSQRQLAELLQVNVRSVQRWESGEREPHPMTLKLLVLLETQTKPIDSAKGE